MTPLLKILATGLDCILELQAWNAWKGRDKKYSLSVPVVAWKILNNAPLSIEAVFSSHPQPLPWKTRITGQILGLSWIALTRVDHMTDHVHVHQVPWLPLRQFMNKANTLCSFPYLLCLNMSMRSVLKAQVEASMLTISWSYVAKAMGTFYIPWSPFTLFLVS